MGKFMDTCTLLTFIKHHVVKLRDDMKKELQNSTAMVNILNGKLDDSLRSNCQLLSPPPCPSGLIDLAGACEQDMDLALRDESLEVESSGLANGGFESKLRRVTEGMNESEAHREQVETQISQSAGRVLADCT